MVYKYILLFDENDKNKEDVVEWIIQSVFKEFKKLNISPVTMNLDVSFIDEVIIFKSQNDIIEHNFNELIANFMEYYPNSIFKIEKTKDIFDLVINEFIIMAYSIRLKHLKRITDEEYQLI